MPGRVTITVSCVTAVSGSGTLFAINFQAVGMGVTPLTFSDTLEAPDGCQINEGTPSCEPSNGQLTVSGAGCPASPASGCRGAGKSLLLLKNSADDTKDKLTWKWLKGAATTVTELGVPTGTTNYALCIYAGTAVATINLLAGPAWQAAGTTGFKFKDPTGTPDGAQKALIKSGGAGKAKALVKGKGTNLPDTLVGVLPLPVTAQLINEQSNLCFEGVYNAAAVIKNDGTQFKAKTP